MNFTSKVNIRFTFSVTLGLYCFCTNVEFLAKCLTNLLAVLLWQTDIWNFFVVFHTLHLLIPQFLWKSEISSMETWFGNIGLNSGKVRLKVMLFILTSKCSHIIDITGRSEDIKKTLMPTVPNNRCQKSWSLYIQRKWKSLYQRIIVQLKNLPHILCHVLLPKLQSALSLVRILSYNFFLPGVSFANLSKPSSFTIECRALRFVEVSVHMQHFVKNIKPQYSYLGKFCRQMQLC